MIEKSRVVLRSKIQCKESNLWEVTGKGQGKRMEDLNLMKYPFVKMVSTMDPALGILQTDPG